MPADVAGVLGGRGRWAVVCGDALEFLRSLPDAAVSLVLFSPPYEAARTYGVGFRLRGQAWVDWIRPVVVEACRVSGGLVAVNAAGQVRKHRYSPVVEWLVADLTRLDGLCVGPSPYAWVRPGIAGSGSKNYHRRNWEPVYCFARPDRLPLSWSHNTAFGLPPRWAPGGEMSHRLSGGERVNQWGRHSAGVKSRKADGDRQDGDRPSHQFATKNAFGVSAKGAGNRRSEGDGERITSRKKTCRQPSGRMEETAYSPPVVANHGNVIRTGNGGNQLGHPLAHENEAPMNLAVAERFVCWYVPPGGVVCDPFAGSGTTCHAAVLHGRRFVGSDVRQSQVDLVRRRLLTITPSLFPEVPT
jgi:hypothetical protein